MIRIMDKNTNIETEKGKEVKGNAVIKKPIEFQKKTMVMISVLFLILIVGVYSLTRFLLQKSIEEQKERVSTELESNSNTEKNEEEREIQDTQEVQKYFYDDGTKYDFYDIVIPLDGDKEILVSNPPSRGDSNFRLVTDFSDRKKWENNAFLSDSTIYYIDYFKDKSKLFGDGSLGSVTVDGYTYKYIDKSVEDGAGSGSVWSTQDTMNLNGYKAYRIIGYSNAPQGEDPSSADFRGIRNSSGTRISCAFILGDIFDGVEGAIKFSYITSGDSNICSQSAFFNFSITMRDTKKSDLENCYSLEKVYKYDTRMGELDSEIIGSWHACLDAETFYCDRYVFYPNGNYLFFPKGGTAQEIEQGIWGIERDPKTFETFLNLARNGDLKNKRSIYYEGKDYVKGDQIPYTFSTVIENTEYWQYSYNPDIWDSRTGEVCESQ